MADKTYWLIHYSNSEQQQKKKHSQNKGDENSLLGVAHNYFTRI